MDKEIIFIKNLLITLDGKTNEEKLRINLYSIMTTVLLSKNIFKKNMDISLFMIKLNIEFKEYVYRSRTSLIARMIREIESADKNKLLVLTNELKTLLFSTPDEQNRLKKNNSNSNSADDILRQFGRQ